jgi:hypothetical protein
MVEMAGHMADLKEFVGEVIAGMSVDELMKKHHVDQTELKRLYSHLSGRELVALLSPRPAQVLDRQPILQAIQISPDVTDELN